MFGAAVSTAMPAAAAYVTAVQAGVGAACTQAWANFDIAHDALQLLDDGASAAAALAILREADPQPEVRQFGIVDANGESAAHTGSDCVGWAGHQTGRDYAVQGNMLVGSDTVTAMAASFEGHRNEDLAERLVRVLEAGQAAGGDKRGRQSAGIYVAKDSAWPYVSLRVDEHPEPIAELRRIFEVAKRQLIPFIEQLPSRSRPNAAPDPRVVAMNLQPPSHRTG
jgi:uncharacterized Ntn-hydrolase superfamily protein